MRRVLALVEGFTERTVVEQTFAPYLGAKAVSLHAKVVGKPGHKGGIRSFESVAREILALLKQEPASYVTTFFDFYGLPSDWPGRKAAKGSKAQAAAQVVEAAMRHELEAKVGGSASLTRFIPYVQMFEMEALLFSDPMVMAAAFERPELGPKFAQIVYERGGCEDINDTPATAPSKRIESLFSSYRKGSGVRAHAPIIVRRIGMDRLRQACPHFHVWIQTLERIGEAV
jgi:hypothetical protein